MKPFQALKSLATGLKNKATVAVAALLAVTLLPSLAQAQVTLPDTGVDVPGLITASITGLGVIVVAALGGYAAFLLVRKAMGWMRRALG